MASSNSNPRKIWDCPSPAKVDINDSGSSKPSESLSRCSSGRLTPDEYAVRRLRRSSWDDSEEDLLGKNADKEEQPDEQDNRRQSPARIRRRTRSSKSSSPVAGERVDTWMSEIRQVTENVIQEKTEAFIKSVLENVGTFIADRKESETEVEHVFKKPNRASTSARSFDSGINGELALKKRQASGKSCKSDVAGMTSVNISNSPKWCRLDTDDIANPSSRGGEKTSSDSSIYSSKGSKHKNYVHFLEESIPNKKDSKSKSLLGSQNLEDMELCGSEKSEKIWQVEEFENKSERKSSEKTFGDFLLVEDLEDARVGILENLENISPRSITVKMLSSPDKVSSRSKHSSKSRSSDLQPFRNSRSRRRAGKVEEKETDGSAGMEVDSSKLSDEESWMRRDQAKCSRSSDESIRSKISDEPCWISQRKDILAIEKFSNDSNDSRSRRSGEEERHDDMEGKSTAREKCDNNSDSSRSKHSEVQGWTVTELYKLVQGTSARCSRDSDESSRSKQSCGTQETLLSPEKENYSKESDDSSRSKSSEAEMSPKRMDKSENLWEIVEEKSSDMSSRSKNSEILDVFIQNKSKSDESEGIRSTQSLESVKNVSERSFVEPLRPHEDSETVNAQNSAKESDRLSCHEEKLSGENSETDPEMASSKISDKLRGFRICESRKSSSRSQLSKTSCDAEKNSLDQKSSKKSEFTEKISANFKVDSAGKSLTSSQEIENLTMFKPETIDIFEDDTGKLRGERGIGDFGGVHSRNLVYLATQESATPQDHGDGHFIPNLAKADPKSAWDKLIEHMDERKIRSDVQTHFWADVNVLETSDKCWTPDVEDEDPLDVQKFKLLSYKRSKWSMVSRDQEQNDQLVWFSSDASTQCTAVQSEEDVKSVKEIEGNDSRIQSANNELCSSGSATSHSSQLRLSSCPATSRSSQQGPRSSSRFSQKRVNSCGVTQIPGLDDITVEDSSSVSSQDKLETKEKQITDFKVFLAKKPMRKKLPLKKNHWFNACKPVRENLMKGKLKAKGTILTTMRLWKSQKSGKETSRKVSSSPLVDDVEEVDGVPKDPSGRGKSAQGCICLRSVFRRILQLFTSSAPRNSDIT